MYCIVMCLWHLGQVKVREKSAEIMQSFQEKERWAEIYLIELLSWGSSTHMQGIQEMFLNFFRELQASARGALEKLAMAEAKATTMQTGGANVMHF